MILRYEVDKIKKILLQQISSFYLESDKDEELLNKYFPLIMKRMESNISARMKKNKYFSQCRVEGREETREPYFNPLHAVQWMTFLYFVANTIYLKEKSDEARELCDKVYGISKALSGADIYYEIDLPDEFGCDHPTGSVMGRAEYGKGFFFMQGCTVGNNKGKYPVIGENVMMYSDSKILGKSKIGNNVILSANTYVKDQNVPDNVIVFGTSPNLIFKERQ